MAEIRDYSTTADDNNASSPNGMANGCAPSTVNDTWREGVARMKRWYEDAQGSKTTGGSSNAYTLAASRTVASYAAGDCYVFKANHTCTSAGSTLNVDSVAAKAIVTPAGAAIGAGGITSGGVYMVAYEASVEKFMLIGGSHSGGDNPFIYNSSPTLTLENSTSEDTSGGRESQVVFKGLQSGSEESTLVKITASHEGTSDDQKGQLVVGVNDGNDNDAPTTAITVASTGNVTLGGNLVIPDAGNIGSASDTDAIAISSAGLVTVSQDLTVSDDVTIGDDLLLDSDAAVIKLGDNQDVTITHNHDKGITLNSKDISGVSSINGTDSGSGANYGQIGGRRNMIYNGDMQVCQRSTSVTGVGDGDTGYIAQDRWKFYEAGSPAAEVTWSQSTTAPDGFHSSLKMIATTNSGTVGADDYFSLSQLFEGQDLQCWNKGDANARSVTLSFWVNATQTGTYCVNLIDADNSSRQISKSYTISSADTWEYKTITFEGDTTGAFDNDTALSLYVYWGLVAGTNYTSGTLGTSWAAYDATTRFEPCDAFDDDGDMFHITGVQMELGDTATAFEYETYGENLARCQRYFNKIALASLYKYSFLISANSAGGTYQRNYISYPVTMRSATQTNTGTAYSSGTLSGAAVDSECADHVIWQTNVTAVGNYSWMSGDLTNDCEL